MLASTGTIVDEQFEIISVLAAGGFGVVYKARQVKLDRIVALKLLGKSVVAGTGDYERFQREIRTMSTLKHRNLVTVYGCGTWRGAPYINMELVDGDSLAQVVERDGPFSTKRALHIVEQILEGLGCAHAHNIIHRDLKPSNVMIMNTGSDELIKIIDFGLAKPLPGSGLSAQKVTDAGHAVGSLMYMSPEQCLAQELDARSDIYAVGCLLHYCLAGTHAYDGHEGTAVMAQHVLGLPTRLSEFAVDADFCDQLQEIVDTAMAKSVDARYQSTEEMLAALRKLEPNQWVNGSRAQALATLKTGGVRHTLRNSLLAVLGLLICAGTFIVGGRAFGPVPRGSTNRTSADYFSRALEARAQHDQKNKVRLFRASLEKSAQDNRLTPLNKVEALSELTGALIDSDPATLVILSEPTLQEAIASGSTINDRAAGVAWDYLKACDTTEVPSRGLPLCEKVVSAGGDILSSGGGERLIDEMIQVYARMGLTATALDRLKLNGGHFPGIADGKNFGQSRALARMAFWQGKYESALEAFDRSSTDEIAFPSLDKMRVLIALNRWAKPEEFERKLKPSSKVRNGMVGVQALVLAHHGNFQKAVELVKPLAGVCSASPDFFKTNYLDFDLKELASACKQSPNGAAYTDEIEKLRHQLKAQYLFHLQQSNIGQKDWKAISES
jgi:serine/threonine protein kinase